MPLKITSTFLLVNQIILRLVAYSLTFFPHLFFFGLFLQSYLSIFTFLSSLWNTVNLPLFQNFFGLTDFLYLRILLVDFKELSSSYYYVPKKDIFTLKVSFAFLNVSFISVLPYSPFTFLSSSWKDTQPSSCWIIFIGRVIPRQNVKGFFLLF